MRREKMAWRGYVYTSCVQSDFRVPTLNRWPVTLSARSRLGPVLRIYAHYFIFNLQNLKGGESWLRR